jgi:hypothetical protein
VSDERAKRLLVLARRDHAEAMRVAAGLTIFGHAVSLVFMDRPVAETAENAANAELLELTGIEPRTTVAAMADDLPLLDASGLAAACRRRRCGAEPAMKILELNTGLFPDAQTVKPPCGTMDRRTASSPSILRAGTWRTKPGTRRQAIAAILDSDLTITI